MAVTIDHHDRLHSVAIGTHTSEVGDIHKHGSMYRTSLHSEAEDEWHSAAIDIQYQAVEVMSNKRFLW